MERKELIEVYKRYTNGLKETEVPIDVVEWNYKITKVIVEYFDEHPEEKDVYQALIYDSLRSAVHYINRFNTKLRELPNVEWDKQAVDRGLSLLSSLTTSMGYFGSWKEDETKMRTSLANFIKLTKELRSIPAVRLFLWQCYGDRIKKDSSLIESSIFIKYAKELVSNPQLKESLDEFEVRLNKAFNPASVTPIIEAFASSSTE